MLSSFPLPFTVSVRADFIPLFKESIRMNQRELNREVSQKTGEAVSTIAAFGFVELTGQPYERAPQTVD